MGTRDDRDVTEASPGRKGIFLAVLAAGMFGVTVPLVQIASAGAGALAAGSLLYLGAAAGALAGLARGRGRRKEAPVRRADAVTLLALGLVGGLLAPLLLVLGLQRADAASASLVLGLEAPFTLVLARVVYREHVGRRVLAAAGLILAGGLLATAGRPEKLSIYGGALIAAATLAWAVDNTLSRALADRDPLAVVAGKGLLGGSAALLAAVAMGQSWPSLARAAGLVIAGALGFGVSLQVYLQAQRIAGAARTASVFALAPFVGAAAALALGTPWPGPAFVLAAVLIGAGVWLHATEHHHHAHVHQELVHEHLHTHDDGHHDHDHEPMPAEPHSHAHRHARAAHAHPHGEDLHHRHDHERTPGSA